MIMDEHANEHHQIEYVRCLAVVVFGTRRSAKRWFRTPARGLDWQIPADLMGTPEGRAQVVTYLWQIEYGVYV